LQGINNKKDTLIDYCQKYNIDLKNVAYVGNDLNDKDAMEIVGITFCPEDAHKSIKAISNHILNTKGGNGVIRELLDFIIKQKGE
jgi:YrbI family 3-deoxy-D-manno-octulosonate 8-phosphate phosphatase